METDRPAWRSRAWLVAVAVLVVLAFVLTTAGFASPVSAWATLVAAAGFTVAMIGWALIRTNAQRRHYEDELAAWAAERATQGERLRIARELHDLASHGLGLITVRAGAARSVTGPSGEAERADALADIERISRQATTELRRMLAVLRTPGPAPLRPGDTLADLPVIVSTAIDAGMTAALGIGELGDVSPGVQLTACAVVREALNNTLRHAGPAHARVEVHRDQDTIVVTVQDDGPHPGWQPQPGAGHGLRGVRERVTTLAGTLEAGAKADGWLLTARIPDRAKT
ncbi:histidine kinase [Actinoplanes sp. NPDC026619]|uniref:sensor histidine kinase n=1 Tax=Actinoplanes sp. NPDC026619 TaxID=3155798 RepID=UPI0034056CE9